MEVVKNPYPKGCFKHDFIEIYNSRVAGKDFSSHPEFLAEICEAAIIASVHGNIYNEETDGTV